MGKVAEIFAELGFKFEKTTLGDFINSIKELDMNVVASAVGVGGLYKAMADITAHAVDAATKLRLFHEETGVPEEDLQRWQKLSKEMGISEDAILGVVKALEARGFQPGQVLPFLKTLSERIKGMSETDATRVLSGFSAESLHAVMTLSDLNDRLEKESVVSDDVITKNAELGKSFRKLKDDWEVFKDSLAAKWHAPLMSLSSDLDSLITEPKYRKDFIEGSKKDLKKTLIDSLFPSVGLLRQAIPMFENYLQKTHLGGAYKIPMFENYLQKTHLGGAYKKWAMGDFATAYSEGQQARSGGAYKKWAMGDFATAYSEGQQARSEGKTVQNNISITVHGMAEGPMALANAIKHELEHLFKGTEAQHANKVT